MADERRNLTEQLKSILHHQAGPYLFVGAGLSRRYAGLPDWQGLLTEFAKFTEKRIEYYLSASDGNFPQAARLISDDFFEIWWTERRFQDSVNEHGELIKDRETPLKFEISKFISEKTNALQVPIELKEEFEAFCKVQIDAIITTNYDDILSQVFPDFRVFVGQEELLFANPQGIAEIYQIHGSVERPSSLILTDKDYDDFNARNAYLAAKLVTVFMEHPVIFLGYSLSDSNVNEILRSILHGIRPKNADRLRSRLIFVEWMPDEHVSITETVITIDEVSLPITRVTTDSFRWIYEVLSSRTRALPAKVLRQLKEQVYRLVQTNDPRHQLVQVAELDENTSADDLDVVFGVGARIQNKGIHGLNRWDLVDDVLDDPCLNVDSDLILNQVISKIALRTYVPIFKYLSDCNLLNKIRKVGKDRLDAKVIKRYENYFDKFENLLREYPLRSVPELLESEGSSWILDHALELPKYTVDKDGLRDMLVKERDLRFESRRSTGYGKLAVVYDWLCFHNQ